MLRVSHVLGGQGVYIELVLEKRQRRHIDM